MQRQAESRQDTRGVGWARKREHECMPRRALKANAMTPALTVQTAGRHEGQQGTSGDHGAAARRAHRGTGCWETWEFI